MNEQEAAVRRKKIVDELIKLSEKVIKSGFSDSVYRKHSDRARELNSELSLLDRRFPPKYDYSAGLIGKYIFIHEPNVPLAHKRTHWGNAQGSATSQSRPISTRTQAAPSFRSSNAYTTYSAPQPSAVMPSRTSTTISSGPHVPVGNKFAAHEQLINKIARRASHHSANWIRKKSEWKPVNNGFSSEYYVDITVHRDGVTFNKLAYEGLSGVRFADFGMENLPESSTEAFLYALKPFVDVYFPEEIKKVFADVSPLIKRTTSVTFDQHHEGWDFEGRSYSKKCIHVVMKYTNPPAPKLKSW